MTDSLGECRVGVNLTDFHLPSDSQALVHELYVIMLNFWFSANLYLTLLPLSKHSVHKDTIRPNCKYMEAKNNTDIMFMWHVLCVTAFYTLLHHPFVPAQTLPTDQRNFKEGCLNLLLFSLHKPQFTISFSHVSSQMFHSCPL